MNHLHNFVEIPAQLVRCEGHLLLADGVPGLIQVALLEMGEEQLDGSDVVAVRREDYGLHALVLEKLAHIFVLVSRRPVHDEDRVFAPTILFLCQLVDELPEKEAEGLSARVGVAHRRIGPSVRVDGHQQAYSGPQLSVRDRVR